MEILLKKQPQKYLKKLDEKTRTKLYAALDEVSEFKGDTGGHEKSIPLQNAAFPHHLRMAQERNRYHGH